MQIKKIFLFLLLGLCIPLLAHAQLVEYDAEDEVVFSWMLSGIQTNQSTVWFFYGWNNFGGLIFLRTPETLAVPEVVQLNGVIKNCYKRIKGIYYNNQRGMRFWPLDQDTLSILQTFSWVYDDVQITGWLFMWCNWASDTYLYVNITHTRSWYDYELIAGVEMNFFWNTYLPRFWMYLTLPIFWQTLRYIPATDGLYLSGHLFDSYGWVWIVRWSGMCIDVRSPNPATVCLATPFLQTSNCGNIQNATWTKNCAGWWWTVLRRDNCCIGSNMPWENDECTDNSPSYYDRTCESLSVHNAAESKSCKYQDEQYLDRWSFIDTTNHRWYEYIEIMRKSCLHRGRWTNQWLWRYDPDSYVTKAEVIKTLVKVMGIAFDDFTIETEDRVYPYVPIFADVATTNRFSWYTEYAYLAWLTQDLYTTKNNKKYINANSMISRNQVIEKIMKIYHVIEPGTIDIASSQSHLVDTKPNDPYYISIREAEELWIISWVPQTNGTYKFLWTKNITRAEFAKMITIPFNGLLFDNSGE